MDIDELRAKIERDVASIGSIPIDADPPTIRLFAGRYRGVAADVRTHARAVRERSNTIATVPHELVDDDIRDDVGAVLTAAMRNFAAVASGLDDMATNYERVCDELVAVADGLAGTDADTAARIRRITGR